MLGFVISKEKIGDIAASLSDYEVFAPIEEDGVAIFRRIKSAKGYKAPSALNTRTSPKGVIFPQTETLFKYKHGKKSSLEAVAFSDKKAVVLGIRPCDARSVAMLARIFADGRSDPYFAKRLENTTFIGMSCDVPGDNCFCTSVGGSPSSKEGLDVLLTDIGEKYYAEALTDKGRRIIEHLGALFLKAAPDDEKKASAAQKHSESQIKRHANASKASEKLDSLFDSPIWAEFGMKCLGCGACTYVCPTCYCFDIRDETCGQKGARVRTWDSCMFPEYTMHASGHNPRPAKMNRIRNRVYHKYNYNKKNFGTIACVGCGRCIDVCSAGNDILEVLSRIEGA